MSDYRVLPTPLPLVLPHRLPACRASSRPAAERIWATAETKVRDLVTRHPGRFPLYTEKGRWAVDAEAVDQLVRGLPRRAAVAARPAHRRRRGSAQQAEDYSEHIEDRKDDRNVHDLGFLFWPTWRRWYEETGDPARNDVVVHAGRTLAMRFNEKGRYLRSFLAADSLFIDIMMNVGIIFHSAQQTGDPDLAPDRRRALPHHPAHPRPRRRQRLPRRHLRPRHRPVPAPDHPTGLARRRLLGPRAGLGDVRLRHRLPLHRRPAVPGHGRRLRRLLPRAHRRPAGAAERLGGARPGPSRTRAPPPRSPPTRSGSWPGWSRTRSRPGPTPTTPRAILVRLAQDDFLAADDAGLGGRAQARHLPRDQEPRRGRVGDVGRLLAARRRRHHPAHRRRGDR